MDPTEASITTIAPRTFEPGHTSAATLLYRAVRRDTYDITQYRDATVSVMVYIVEEKGRNSPVVMSLNEEFERLMADLGRLFDVDYPREMHVEWRGPGAFGFDTFLHKGNLMAALRLIKARGGVDMLTMSYDM